MEASKHAHVRSQQRGISYDCIKLIVNFGTVKKRPGGASEYRLSKKDKENAIKHYKHQIQILDKVDKKAVLVSDDTEEIITVYNLT